MEKNGKKAQFFFHSFQNNSEVTQSLLSLKSTQLLPLPG